MSEKDFFGVVSPVVIFVLFTRHVEFPQKLALLSFVINKLRLLGKIFLVGKHTEFSN